MLSDEQIKHFQRVNCVYPGTTRAIEAAATEPLLKRIAELEQELAENVRLNGIGSEREAALMSKAERLERELETVRKDAERLDWMIFYSAQIRHTSDAEYCRVEWSCEGEEIHSAWLGSGREAIDAAKEQR